MSKTVELAEAANNQVYTGFDSMATIQFCTPAFVGCKVCIGANTVGSSVTLSLSVSTPFGSYTKAFKINSNVCFTYQPVSLFKVDICVKNFKKIGHTFSFDVSAKGCLKVPIFGWKCYSYSYHFSVPTPFSESHASLLSDGEDINEKDYGTYLALYALATQEQAECNCH